MKYEKGNWRVMRNRYADNVSSAAPQKRIVQADGYSERYARFVASNWQSYNATAEPNASPVLTTHKSGIRNERGPKEL